MQEQRRPIESPLRTTKTFHRPVGAHSILTSLLLWDLVGLLFWLLIGAYSGTLTLWMLHTVLSLLHASILLTGVGFLILFCIAAGFVRRHNFMYSADEAWSWPSTIILILLATLLSIFLLKNDWLKIPARTIPTGPAIHSPWPHTFSPLGATCAALLYALAHVLVLRQFLKCVAEQGRSFSRGNDSSNLSRWIGQTYAIYRTHLKRFDPPLHLKTPPTFSFYTPQSRKAEEIYNPEREFFWANGILVLNQNYIGSAEDQASILLPLLARLLYDYNASDWLVERCFQFLGIASTSFFTRCLLLIPIHFAHSYQEHWDTLEREHVLDRDRFAFFCGEAKLLRQLLRLQRAEIIKREQEDNTIPSLAERLDHLDGLINRETLEVREFREAAALGQLETTRLEASA